jgi:hypothetical protein
VALYTFYCWRADGSGGSFETRELDDDARAMALAPRILADHASCVRVEVWQGDHEVGAVGPD